MPRQTKLGKTENCTVYLYVEEYEQDAYIFEQLGKMGNKSSFLRQLLVDHFFPPPSAQNGQAATQVAISPELIQQAIEEALGSFNYAAITPEVIQQAVQRALVSALSSGDVLEAFEAPVRLAVENALAGLSFVVAPGTNGGDTDTTAEGEDADMLEFMENLDSCMTFG